MLRATVASFHGDRTPRSLLHAAGSLRAFLCALLCLVAIDAAATDLRSVLTDYALESWSQKDGLPDSSIYVLAQDGDGYIWAGT